MSAAALQQALTQRVPAAVLACLAEESCPASDGREEQGAAGEGGAEYEAASFTDAQLAWGRKEAKSKLSAEDFREWRKAVKKAGKNKG